MYSTDDLNATIINNQLTSTARSLFPTLLILPLIDSTNTYLLNLSSIEAHSGYVCIAEQQTAGRGRQGRQWISPAMQNIYLSILSEMPAKHTINGLSLVIGMAVIRALQKIGVTTAQVKWPNDIIVDGKKLAGILVEIDPRATHYLVMGIGVNVHMPPSTNIGQPWISVDQLVNTAMTRNALAADILNCLAEELDEFNQHGLQSLYADWHEIDALKNLPICVQQGNQTHYGIASGINNEGALLLAVEGQVIAVYSGEVVKVRVLP